MIESSKFSMPTKKIFLGVLIYVIAGLVYSVVKPIHFAASVANAMLSGAGSTGAGIVAETLYYLALVSMVVGYVFTFLGLNGFKAVAGEVDAKSIGTVRTSYILLVIAAAIVCIPGVKWLAGTLTFISAIFLVLGYTKLRKSEYLVKEMKDGFKILFLSAVFILIAECFDFIPIVGNFTWPMLNFVAMIITLIGWNKVKRGALKA